MAMLWMGKPAVAAKGEIELPPRVRHTLANGLKLTVVERGPLPMVAIRVAIAAGSASDPKDRAGLADMVATLLRRGTRQLTADQINEAIEFVGGSLSVGATEDYLTLALSAPAEHAGAMIDIVGQLVREPTFPPAEVESARRRTLAQIANHLDDPSAVADRAFTYAIWGEHPYGHDVLGRSADLKRISRDDLIAFHRGRMGPRLAHLAIVGAVDAAQVTAAVEKAFGGWSGGPTTPVALPTPTAPALAGKVLIVDKPDQTQTQVRVGALGIPRGHDDAFGLSAVNGVLGGGFTSRLMTEVRVKRGLSYGVGSHGDPMRAAGAYGIMTFTKTESTRQILDVVLDEVAKMRKKGPSPAELKTTKTYLGGLFPMKLETNEAIAGALADLSVYGLGDEWITEYHHKLWGVTPAQASRVAAERLPGEQRVIVLVGNAEAIRPQVKGLGEVVARKVSDFE